MKNLNFLPVPYEKKQTWIRARRLIAIYGVIIMLNIYFIYEINIQNLKYDDYIINDFEEVQQVQNIENNSIKEFKSMLEVYTNIKNKIGTGKLESADITNKDINIVSKHNTVNEYILFIKEIENDEKYRIIDIKPPKQEGEFTNSMIINYAK